MCTVHERSRDVLFLMRFSLYNDTSRRQLHITRSTFKQYLSGSTLSVPVTLQTNTSSQNAGGTKRLQKFMDRRAYPDELVPWTLVVAFTSNGVHTRETSQLCDVSFSMASRLGRTSLEDRLRRRDACFSGTWSKCRQGSLINEGTYLRQE